MRLKSNLYLSVQMAVLLILSQNFSKLTRSYKTNARLVVK
ncbi:hypothetical protein PRUB_b1329 [Pseudoalteromonas rubra]|uniref:Uncharacterized protein n=1 Tax=Pseudoalteromonas rubra TaxID=43658 RepID=A0A8T0C413_9GAMM|nr:hypothetical protein PRUB_b1329 [Pseudoalteromonas rubra]